MPANFTNIDFLPSPKQFLAYDYLTDTKTTEVFFGGSIRSGKTRLAMYWLIMMCMKYAGTRYLVGRAILKTLNQTTINTFHDIIKEWGLQGEINHNKKDDIIKFRNGSEVIIKSLHRDPTGEYNELRGLELTAAIIDEANEIDVKAYQALLTRLDYKLDVHGLCPKLLVVSNPSKGWLYDKYYIPHKNGTLPPHRKVILAVPADNPYNSQAYLDTLTLDNLGEAFYQMLVLGNWEFDPSDLALFDYFTVNAAFARPPQTGFGIKYITIDPAASGADTTVIALWQGWHCQQVIQIENSDTLQTVNKVRELQAINNVHITNIIVDKIGIGQGVFDLLQGCKGFIANATAIKGEPYKSLKDQCYYILAKQFQNGLISFTAPEVQQTLTQELEAHKIHNLESDGKAQVTPKKLVKQLIGRSPDIADAIMMRAYFEQTAIGKIAILR